MVVVVFVGGGGGTGGAVDGGEDIDVWAVGGGRRGCP